MQPQHGSAPKATPSTPECPHPTNGGANPVKNVERTDLVTDALRMAASTRGRMDGAVFHSDHGAKYGSRAFTALCDELGVAQSMGAVGTSVTTQPAKASTRP
ncbi:MULTISPECIES: DDE-type integrase/transposase/recombinase [unclassified Streptomyces]|uniref:DDE-type integrase/transposase/recombinase n=1 Tax=unclassified Streptomyces TaxID=2593676 RepID=UPI002ED097CB